MRPVKDNLAKLSPTHYYMFPRAVGEDLMRYDLQKFQEIRQFNTRKHGTVLGEVYKPTNQINNHQQTMHYMDEQATQKYRKVSDEYDMDIGPYQSLKKGDSLYKFAVKEAEMVVVGPGGASVIDNGQETLVIFHLWIGGTAGNGGTRKAVVITVED